MENNQCITKCIIFISDHSLVKKDTKLSSATKFRLLKANNLRVLRINVILANLHTLFNNTPFVVNCGIDSLIPQSMCVSSQNFI